MRKYKGEVPVTIHGTVKVDNIQAHSKREAEDIARVKASFASQYTIHEVDYLNPHIEEIDSQKTSVEE